MSAFRPGDDEFGSHDPDPDPRQPTNETYGEFQQAYAYYNAELFSNELPDCLITLQRKPRCRGYFCGDRFASGAALADEIALNPKLFPYRTDADILSTLVHEMVHLWQHHFGKPGRRGYHNREWAGQMLAKGLRPTDTGGADGKMTGESVTHYIVYGGPFDLATTHLLHRGFRISWLDRVTPLPTADAFDEHVAANRRTVFREQRDERPSNARAKFSCVACGQNAWAKPSATLVCGACGCALTTE